MISTIYKKLFNTVIAHDFFVDGISRNDLAVAPTAETRKAMNNNNLVYRNEAGGFRLFYHSDENGVPFIAFSNLRLVFTLNLQNVLELFTNLDKGLKKYVAGKIIYFTNKGTETQNELAYDLLDYLKPAMFTYVFTLPAGQNTGHIEIKNENGDIVTPSYPDPDSIAISTNGNFLYPIDFSGMPKGVYTFSTWGTGTPAPKTIYIDNDMAQQNVFGIVDITALTAGAASFPPLPGNSPFPLPPVTEERTYNMRFVRKTSQWRYIVVLKSPGFDETTSIGIKDEEVQQPYGELFFTTSGTPVTVNGLPARIITSTVDSIPYYEMAKKNLSIKKDPADPSPVTVLQNIPGPLLGSVSGDALNPKITEIYLYL